MLIQKLSLKNIGVATTRAGNVIGGADWSENRVVPDIVRSIKITKNYLLEILLLPGLGNMSLSQFMDIYC